MSNEFYPLSKYQINIYLSIWDEEYYQNQFVISAKKIAKIVTINDNKKENQIDIENGISIK